MAKYLLLLLLIIATALGWMSFGFETSLVEAEPPFSPPQPHYYKDPSVSIKEIVIGAVYFAPKNKEKTKTENWKELLEEHLVRLKEFHSFQFQGYSSIRFIIYPEVITGLKENLAYDTDVTQNGNPSGLINVTEEINSRLLSLEGDQYWAEFASEKHAYPVLYILYEGVGASGTDGVALLSRQFLSDPQYADQNNSFFAHEFYHTVGIPDAYGENSHAYSSDLMGLGRFLPLAHTYLDRATLKELGL